MKHFNFFAVTTLLMVMIFPMGGHAQFQTDVTDMSGNLIVGGNLGFGLTTHNGLDIGGVANNNTTYFLNFEFSPQVGYRIIDPLEVGARIVYHLEWAHNKTAGYKEACNYIGISPYLSYQFWRGFYVQGEYEGLYGFSRKISNGEAVKGAQWYNSVFLGLGYRLYLGTSSYAYVAGFYDMLSFVENHVTPYSSPWVVRLGFCYGINLR